MPRAPSGQVVERQGQRTKSLAIRVRAYGTRQYVTLGNADEGWTRSKAEDELANVLADVRRGIWRPGEPAPQVELPAAEPTFHVFASEWLEGRRPELRPRTLEALEWALSGHLLPFFKSHRPSQITVAEVDRYRSAKVRESADIQARRDKGDDVVERPLSNRSINQTIAVLAQVLDVAAEHGWVTIANPARGKRRRLRAERPRRTWLELHELRALLDAAGDHRALLAPMAMGGLRVGELVDLRWGAVDLANSRLHVVDSKTDAGRRTVDLSPDLGQELRARKAAARNAEAGDLVFPTRAGTKRDRHNVRARVLAGVVTRANKKLTEAGHAPIVGVTNHSLRRTFASLLYEAGASPAYVMGQMGHTSASMALEVYSKMMTRDRDTGARVDALVRGVDWAPMGTNDVMNDTLDESSVEAMERHPA